MPGKKINMNLGEGKNETTICDGELLRAHLIYIKKYLKSLFRSIQCLR